MASALLGKSSFTEVNCGFPHFEQPQNSSFYSTFGYPEMRLPRWEKGVLKIKIQAYSYARLMRSSIMGICDKDRLIIYRADSNGVFDRNCPAFENHWTALKETEIFNQLQQVIAKEIVHSL